MFDQNLSTKSVWPSVIKGEQRGSSYAVPFSLSSFLTTIPDLILEILIDVLVLTIKEPCEPWLWPYMDRACFFTQKEVSPKNSPYRRQRFLYSPILKRKIRVLFRLSPFTAYRPAVMIYIHRPTRNIIHFLDQVFTELRVSPSLFRIEIDLDFHTSWLQEIRRLLLLTSFLRNQAKPSFFYGDTFYTTDVRGSSKGTRQYSKTEDGITFERLELVLGSRPIRSNLNWPLDDIDDLNLWKFINFKRLDQMYLRKALAKHYTVRGNSVTPEDEEVVSFSNHLCSLPLMQAVDILKDTGLKNHGRYLTTLTWFQDWVDEQRSRQSFLPMGQPV